MTALRLSSFAQVSEKINFLRHLGQIINEQAVAENGPGFLRFFNQSKACVLK